MKLQVLLLPDEHDQPASLLNAPGSLFSASATAEEVVQILLQKVASLSAERPTDPGPNLPAPTKYLANLCLSVADGLIFIPLNEIRYVKADGPYSEIHFAQDKMVLIAKTLKEICRRIIHPSFERVHQSFLVNLDWVEKLHRDGYLVLKTQERISVSRTNRQRVIDALMATKNA